jgi:hypothetical protein
MVVVSSGCTTSGVMGKCVVFVVLEEILAHESFMWRGLLGVSELGAAQVCYFHCSNDPARCLKQAMVWSIIH